jgi:hypothetical protein
LSTDPNPCSIAHVNFRKSGDILIQRGIDFCNDVVEEIDGIADDAEQRTKGLAAFYLGGMPAPAWLDARGLVAREDVRTIATRCGTKEGSVAARSNFISLSQTINKGCSVAMISPFNIQQMVGGLPLAARVGPVG